MLKMSNKTNNGSRIISTAAREQKKILRRAQALRLNLRKRKTQQRGRLEECRADPGTVPKIENPFEPAELENVSPPLPSESK